MTVGRITFRAMERVVTPSRPKFAIPRHGSTIATNLEEALRERIAWLEDKEREQRRVGGPDYTRNPLLLGRTQGAIGELRRLLGQLLELMDALDVVAPRGRA